MTENNLAVSPGKTGWPRWVIFLLKWMAIGTALVGGFAALVIALAKAADGVGQLCKSAPFFCNVVSYIAPKALPAKDIGITDYTSDWMPGRHNSNEACDAERKALQAKYPNYSILVTPSGEDSRKSWLGHVEYRYRCTVKAY